MYTNLCETIKLKPAESFTVEINSRGALGLQLLYRVDDASIVTITRNNSTPSNYSSVAPGDAIKITFEIKAVTPGTVKITFYETQPWNKNFKEIIQKEIIVQVI